MKICFIRGSHALESSPRISLFTGTSRQPRTDCPSSATTPSNSDIALEHAAASGERYRNPTAYRPSAGNAIPKSAETVSKNLWGNWKKIPAPSPVFASHPHPPRWSIFTHISNAPSIMLEDLFPLRWQRNPTPHESFSLMGSYNPCLGGTPEERGRLRLSCILVSIVSPA